MHEICQNKKKKESCRPQPIIIVGINPEQNHKNQTPFLESASSKCPSLEYRTFLKLCINMIDIMRMCVCVRQLCMCEGREKKTDNFVMIMIKKNESWTS